MRNNRMASQITEIWLRVPQNSLLRLTHFCQGKLSKIINTKCSQLFTSF